MKRILNIIILAVIWCGCALVPVIAEEDADRNNAQYKIKIAFIYNFLKFVDWPGATSPQKTNSANVCIVGDKDFSNYFSNFQRTHKQSFVINVNDSVSGNDIAACNVLYIGKNDEGRVSSIISLIRHHPVLSISEAKDFADDGGIIEMVKVGKNVGLFSKDKINLRINMKAAETGGLIIDARLLQIAAEVIK